jgi:DNA-binding response OmpR family regulator
MNKLKILVVEDDANLGNLLAEYLNAKGYDATRAENGKEGLRAYKQGYFDFLILDVMMPVKDGFTLAREIRLIDTEICF